MLDALRFVKGAISKDPLVPELTHFRIANNRVTGFNGIMALSAPIDTDIQASPHASTFYRAISSCEGPTTIEHKQESNQLLIRSGRMRVHVPCIENVGYNAMPQGESYPSPPGLVEMLNTVAPFIGEDASRPWSLGAMFLGPYLYATNNICIVQLWTGLGMPAINLPYFAIKELLRARVDPVRMQSDESSLTFHFEDGRWLRTQLFDILWPMELINKIFTAIEIQTPVSLPQDFAATVDLLYGFMEGKSDPVYFNAGGISSTETGATGAFFEVDPPLPEGPCFSIHHLRLIAHNAHAMDFTAYPDPCVFYGKSMRGVALGRKR